MSERVILAYSGGLDTSVAISWIGKETGREVVAVAIDLGQGGEDMEVVRQRALDCGAVEAVVVDARDEFAEEYCLPTIKSNALYMDRYPLVSAISRPLIVKHLVEAAREYGGGIVAHGCTGKGNDQVRFEVGFASLAPDLEVLAPVRDYAWTREKAIAFAEENAIPINVTKRSPFSIDQNVWGRAVETGFLEHLWNAPTKDVYDYTEDPTVNWSAPDEVDHRLREGRAGLHRRQAGHACSRRSWSSTGARARRVSAGSTSSRTGSSASRAARSTRLPAPWCSSPRTPSSSTSRWSANSAGTSGHTDQRWGELVYDGLWYSPLKVALETFVENTQEHVTGEIRLVLHGGAHRGQRQAQHRVALRLQPGHLRRGRHVRPVQRQGFRARPRTVVEDRRAAGPEDADAEQTQSPQSRVRDFATARGGDVSTNEGLAVGRPVRGRTRRRPCRAEQVHPLRLGAGALRRARVQGARPRAVPGRSARPRSSATVLAGLGQPRRPTSPTASFGPMPSDEDVHGALERGLIDRVGDGSRRAPAGRAVAQRPGGHAVPDVAARRDAPASATACSTSSRRWPPRRPRIPPRSCRARRTCSRRSRSCWRTTCSRTRTRCCATWQRIVDFDARAAVSPYGSGALAGFLARPRSRRDRRGARLRPRRPTTPSTPRRPATSPPRRRSCWR